jgi:hypothetical protein
MIPNGSACYGPRRRVPRAEGPGGYVRRSSGRQMSWVRRQPGSAANPVRDEMTQGEDGARMRSRSAIILMSSSALALV